MTTLSFRSAFEADAELNQYGSERLSIFALSHYLSLEDPHEFASSSILGGGNDKGLDICSLDEEAGRLVLAQSYLSERWDKASAPGKKASDLNTAVNWLLLSNLNEIPPGLKDKAAEVREALRSGSIRKIELLYIHNCPESENVASELKAAAGLAQNLAASYLPDEVRSSLQVHCEELGQTSIESLFKARDTEILVEDWIEVPIKDLIEEQGPEWRGILASVPIGWIKSLYQTYQDSLFSANFRDYMGYARREGNVNFRIVETANTEAANFWVYNNGITALTYELETGKGVRVRGLSIINGAQTTGALESANGDPDGKVLMRFVECDSKEIIDKIIKYNNTQNEIKPFDQRSNDPVQKRLKAEFEAVDIEYTHRRSSARISRNAITAAIIAPALCAFHGDLQTAYRNSKSIFNDDGKYQSVFRSSIPFQHIFLLKTLSSSIDDLKNELKEKVDSGQATELEIKEHKLLGYAASKLFMLFIVGKLAEELLGHGVPDLFEWKCINEVISPENNSLRHAWDSTIRAIIPQITQAVERHGENAFYEVPRSAELSKNVAQHLKGVIASLQPQLAPLFKDLRDRSKL